MGSVLLWLLLAAILIAVSSYYFGEYRGSLNFYYLPPLPRHPVREPTHERPTEVPFIEDVPISVSYVVPVEDLIHQQGLTRRYRREKNKAIKEKQ